MTEPEPTDNLNEADLLLLVRLAAEQVVKGRAALAAHEAARDDLVRQASARGISAEFVAAAADVHIQRVYQIRRAGRKASVERSHDEPEPAG